MSSLTLLRPATPPSLYMPLRRDLGRSPSPQPSLQSELSDQEAYEIMRAHPAQQARAISLQPLRPARTPSPRPAYPGATGATPGPPPGPARPPRLTSPAPWAEPDPAPSRAHRLCLATVRVLGAVLCLAIPGVLVYAGVYNKNHA